jgi:hypothetical protein
MNHTTIKIAGIDAVRVLNEYQSQYPATGRYPFLIGDPEELERLQGHDESDQRDPADIIQVSKSVI